MPSSQAQFTIQTNCTCFSHDLLTVKSQNCPSSLKHKLSCASIETLENYLPPPLKPTPPSLPLLTCRPTSPSLPSLSHPPSLRSIARACAKTTFSLHSCYHHCRCCLTPTSLRVCYRRLGLRRLNCLGLFSVHAFCFYSLYLF